MQLSKCCNELLVPPEKLVPSLYAHAHASGKFSSHFSNLHIPIGDERSLVFLTKLVDWQLSLRETRA